MVLAALLRRLRLCLEWLASLLRIERRRRRWRRRDRDDDGRGEGLSLSSWLFGLGRTSAGTTVVTFDSGLRAEVGRQIAEGGFSYVFEAFPLDEAAALRSSSAMTLDSDEPSEPSRSGDGRPAHRSHSRYALKRIHCPDRELVQACRREAGAHRSLPPDHPNLMELLGLKFDRDDRFSSSSSSSSSSTRRRDDLGDERHEYNVCYMLFPHVPRSLRGEIAERNLLSDPAGAVRAPFSTRDVLQLFGGLLDGLTAVHGAGLSHRDFKLENILLRSRGYGDGAGGSGKAGGGGNGGAYVPVVTDFGSAGPLTSPLTTRRDVLAAVEEAASHTTMPYRPPELFEGGTRHGPDAILDYGRVDVWSLGCVLFGILHGASPFESEFVREDDASGDAGGRRRQRGLVRVVECTHLRVLGDVPFPPWATAAATTATTASDAGGIGDVDDGLGGRNGRYPLPLYRFVRYLADRDRTRRPDVRAAAATFRELHSRLLGEAWVSYEDGRRDGASRSFDEFDSLVASRDFV